MTNKDAKHIAEITDTETNGRKVSITMRMRDEHTLLAEAERTLATFGVPPVTATELVATARDSYVAVDSGKIPGRNGQLSLRVTLAEAGAIAP